MIDVEDVQDHGLKSIGGDQAVRSSKKAAFIVTPCFDLHCCDGQPQHPLQMFLAVSSCVTIMTLLCRMPSCLQLAAC